MRLDEAWSAVTASPVFGVVLTLAAYEVGRRLWERSGRHPLVNPVPVVASVVLGSGAAVLTAYAVTRLLGGASDLALSSAPKTATAAVSLALSAEIGGIPALTAVLTIMTGILGAVAGPRLLSFLRLRDPRVRGLAIGTSSHGIGTAQMLHEGPRQGAFSGLAMALTTLTTTAWVALLAVVVGG